MADQPPVAQGPKRGRRITACAQCQKRKKKCDRQWPCNHCRKRNSAHECEYEGKMAPRPEAPVPDQGIQEFSSESTSASAAVTSLGYISDPMFKTITTTAQPDDAIGLPGPALEASRTVPPRPYADILVQNFFDHVNHHYCVLYKPSFQASYELWWSRRRDASSLCTASTIAATSLILRVCANSIQFLPVDTQVRLEEDLGETVASLGQRYHTAANTLGDLIPPGVAGLVNAQQLFLGATWSKAEANFVDSWHMLADSVRQAQEIGIDTDSATSDMTGFERDSRRRLWCSLDTWDKFMAAVFNRPTIISSGPVPYPSSTLDLSGRNLDAPSATLAKILENQLSRVLSRNELTNQTLEEQLAAVENWVSGLPPVFSTSTPDKRWDDEAPWLRFQRLQLHCVGYMTQLNLLKGALAIKPQRQSHVERAADTGLVAMEVCKGFFELCFPQQAKYFMVSFCPFDVAALLCSLLLGDKDKTLSRRHEIVGAVGSALSISSQLRGHTKMGESTWVILNALVSQLRLSPDGSETLRDWTKANGQNVLESQHTRFNGGGTEIQSSRLPDGPTTTSQDQWQNEDMVFNTDIGVDFDLGVLEGVWDWPSVSQ